MDGWMDRLIDMDIYSVNVDRFYRYRFYRNKYRSR